MAQDWVERDMNAVLSKDGLTVDSANDEQLDGALERVDGVMEALTERAKELGVAIGLSLAEEEAAARAGPQLTHPACNACRP
jgi:type IV secretion system T-DNA border endonuclease VirD2